jgi:hypothetical protein
MASMAKRREPTCRHAYANAGSCCASLDCSHPKARLLSVAVTAASRRYPAREALQIRRPPGRRASLLAVAANLAGSLPPTDRMPMMQVWLGLLPLVAPFQGMGCSTCLADFGRKMAFVKGKQDRKPLQKPILWRVSQHSLRVPHAAWRDETERITEKTR